MKARTYKNDPWKDEKFWAEGYAQLTQTGKQQMYELGSYLRQRYYKLLPNRGKYHVNDVLVKSTDIDRTLNSAAYMLAAMFPPMEEQIWHKSLMWQASNDVACALQKEVSLSIHLNFSFQLRYIQSRCILTTLLA